MTNKEKIQMAEDSLLNHKKRIDKFLETYLNEKLIALKALDPLGEETGELLKEFSLNGGKRFRAAFTYYGYRAAGEGDEENILYASAAMELLHSFFLIHDDIIDKSDLRRGSPSIHVRYKQIYENKGFLSNLEDSGKTHLTSSMAIINGDACSALAYEALIDSGFQAEKIVQVLKVMHEIVKFTAIGELLDIIATIRRDATEEEVLKMHYLKTARYTIEGPLHAGAILHGTTPSTLALLSKYAIPVGIAFQIHDDILGIYGTEEQLGKPVGSDIREGKQTLLTVSAFKNAPPSQKKKLESFIGNPHVTKADIDEVKRIIEDTGSLDYSKMKEIQLIEEGRNALLDSPIREDIKDILLGTADLLIERKY